MNPVAFHVGVPPSPIESSREADSALLSDIDKKLMVTGIRVLSLVNSTLSERNYFTWPAPRSFFRIKSLPYSSAITSSRGSNDSTAMSRIEELPDDYHSTTDDALPGPSMIPPPTLPPQMAASRTTGIDKVAADLKRTPFFMTSVEDASLDDNAELEAMRALQYEGTRLEIASGFRETGNEMTRAKKWSDGKVFYTKALAALKVPRQDWEENEDKKERAMEEACYVNRALCNLELSTSLSKCFFMGRQAPQTPHLATLELAVFFIPISSFP